MREKIRTPDTLVRSQVLYPAELHVHKRILFRIRFQCRRPESNRYGRLVPQDFKSCASASSATPAFDGTNRARTCDPLLVRQVLSQLSYAHIFTCRGTPRMPATGIEPVLYFYNRILSPARLPVPPRRLVIMSGTNWARTYDPLLVRQMLSQLSYDPMFGN